MSDPEDPGVETPENALTPEGEVLALCAERERDDVGLGERFRIRFGDMVPLPDMRVAMRVAHIGWHIYDGRRWKEDEDDRLTRPLAHITARSIYLESGFIRPTESEEMIMQSAEISREIITDLGDWDNKWDDSQKADYRGAKDQIRAAEKISKQVKDRKASVYTFAKSACGTSKIDNLLKESGPYLSRTVDELNTDRLALNCASGLLHFEDANASGVGKKQEASSGEAARGKKKSKPNWSIRPSPHASEALVTKLIDHEVDLATEFDPEADCPIFTRFLETVMPNEELRDFLQRYCGLALTGLVSEQCLVFFLGIGRNGKSTFLDLITHIMADYAVTLSIDSLAGENRRSGAEATPDLARLPGARLVVASEPEEGVVLKEALIKTLTGGEKFPVRRLNKDFFEVDPHFKIILAGNHAPRIRNDDDGIWRRIHLVPWDVQIPESEVDRDLPRKLKEESAGVFRWMIEGALIYLQTGLRPPVAVKDATTEYRQESDPVGEFIREACHVTGGDNDTEAPKALYEAYCRYCDAEGLYQFNRAAFSKRFAKASQKGWRSSDDAQQRFRKAKTAGTTVYRGILIKPDWLGGAGDSEDPGPGYGEEG